MLHVYEAGGDEAAFVKRKVVSLLPRYFISAGEELHELVREISSPLHPRYVMKGAGWAVRGDFYELEVTEGRDVLLCLCVALEIECVALDMRDFGGRFV